jgi:hypothetical protein
MSTRTKLTLVSLATMMLPYRIEYAVAVLVSSAIMCTVSRNFTADLYHGLKSRPLSAYHSATEVTPRSNPAVHMSGLV